MKNNTLQLFDYVANEEGTFTFANKDTDILEIRFSPLNNFLFLQLYYPKTRIPEKIVYHIQTKQTIYSSRSPDVLDITFSPCDTYLVEYKKDDDDKVKISITQALK